MPNTASNTPSVRGRALSGMRGFTVFWAGQFVSILGTSMTNFALTIWAWERTGAATALALVGFSFTAPYILASPLAGALVDRWNRKLVMMLSDLAAGASTVAVLLLASGRLEIWHFTPPPPSQGPSRPSSSRPSPPPSP